MPQDGFPRSFPLPVLFERYSSILVAHAVAYALQDLAIEMHGAQMDPHALAFVERAVRVAEQRMDALDTAFPNVVDRSIVDVVRSALAGVSR